MSSLSWFIETFKVQSLGYMQTKSKCTCKSQWNKKYRKDCGVVLQTPPPAEVSERGNYDKCVLQNRNGWVPGVHQRRSTSSLPFPSTTFIHLHTLSSACAQTQKYHRLLQKCPNARWGEFHGARRPCSSGLPKLWTRGLPEQRPTGHERHVAKTWPRRAPEKETFNLPPFAADVPPWTLVRSWMGDYQQSVRRAAVWQKDSRGFLNLIFRVFAFQPLVFSLESLLLRWIHSCCGVLSEGTSIYKTDI